MSGRAMSKGLFVGLITLDTIYRAADPPQRNQKLVATDWAIAAGGPATNAAVTFAHLDSNTATVMGVVGSHPLARAIEMDLSGCGVEVIDLDPERTEPPPVSSIVVTEATGDRAVISINATRTQASADAMSVSILQGVDVVLVDGHQMELGRAIAQAAKQRGIPVVMDGGSWKPGCDRLLPFIDYAICSANFFPPGCRTQAEVIAYLRDLPQVPQVAITRGDRPILYRTAQGEGEIAIPAIAPVDTLGAGDVFHGAFCHYLLQQAFPEALAAAAQVASLSCQFFGSRAWMERKSI